MYFEVIVMGFPKKPEEEKYKRMNITLPPDLNERLEEYCKKDGIKACGSRYSVPKNRRAPGYLA